MSEPQPRVPDPEEQFERERAGQVEGTSQNLASQAGGDPTQFFEDEDHWDRLGEFDIDRDEVPDEIAEVLATELSNKYTFGNITWDEWRMFGFWGENEIHTTLKEYPDQDTLAKGTDYYIMYGQDEGMHPDREDGPKTKTPLTDEDVRRMWSAADAKRMGMTGAVNARFLSALTEITTVGRTEREEIGTEEKGWLEKVKDRL